MEVSGGIITRCIYDISTKGNVIEIPDVLDGQTITGIGNYAFSVAGKIAVLTLPSTLKTIGDGVFEGHALTELVIPGGVVSIGNRAFYNNALSSINLPSGLVTIGYSAFELNQLSNVTLPDGIKRIESSAFANNKIAGISIPGSLEFLGNSAFYNNKISVLNFDAECKLKEIQGFCFYRNDIRTVNIPSSILVIHDYAFSSNQNLNNVTFGTSLVKIKRGAFASCNLSSIKLPESLVFIGRFAFEGNYNLMNFRLPTSVNKYKWYASNGYQHDEGALVTDKYYSYVAIIPYTLQNKDVTVVNGVITGCSYFNDITNIASVITIPGNLNGQKITGIGNSVFGNKGISKINLPEGIQVIQDYAFSNNEIIELSVPGSLTNIGNGSFRDNCINNLTFEQPSNLETIGLRAFGFNRIIQIDFPNSVKKIEKYAFENNFLNKISFEENSELLSIGSYAFSGNSQLVNFTLPDPKMHSYEYWIDWNSKKYSTNLIVTNFESFYKIPIEYTLTDADVRVENGVIISFTPTNMYANIITIPDELDGQEIKGINNEVFRSVGLIGVILPSKLKNIEGTAFSENDILTVTIPESVEKIEYDAFGRNNINNLIFEENSKLKYIGWGAFSSNKITSLTLPANLNSIAGYAFAYNKISNAIVVPDGVESIGDNAFYGNLIPQLTFNENSKLSYLGVSAFAFNAISNDIYIPLTLTEISDYAFYNNKINKVIIHEGIVDYGNGAFYNNGASLKIVLHEPPTIPFLTHFWGWKDSDGVYHYPGESIADFSKRYKAVIDQYFIVKFVIEDDNHQPVENASIQFFKKTLTSNENGIDSIGPVMRGVQNYTVTADGCYGLSGNVDVQDDMTVKITLVRYYKVNINVVDKSNNPIQGADLMINQSSLETNSKGNVNLNLVDGNYPFVVNFPGFKESASSVTVLDADTTVTLTLYRVLVNNFPNKGNGVAFTDTTYGSTYLTNNNPFTRNAYSFSHWNTEADNTGTSYSEMETIALGFADIDLYATWSPVDYNIIYHLDGGTNHKENPAVYNIESEISFLPAEKTSLYFATWLDKDKNRINRINAGNTGDVELWAVFTTEPTYFIDYHNIENASHSNQSSYTKFDLPFVFNDAIKTGYSFDGWFIDSVFSGQITSVPANSTENYNVYAKWGAPINYSINYELNGGTNNPSNPAGYTIESEKIVFLPPLKRPGANFINWYNDFNLTQKITDIPAGTVGDTTIYAKWEISTYNIQYVLSGGINNDLNPKNYTIESNDILFEFPSKPGAKFMGWYSDKDLTATITGLPNGSYGDTVIYAKWELELYNIDYVLNGGINNQSNPENYTIESNSISFFDAERTGYVFKGWFDDNLYSDKIVEIPAGSTGDTLLFAKWELDTFNINYVLYGGNNDLSNPDDYTIESDTISLENPDKPGYIFDGWYMDTDFYSSIQTIPSGNDGDITIFAKWIELFNVNFVITTDGKNPAKDVDIHIDNTTHLYSGVTGLADTIVADGSILTWSVGIDGIIIEDGIVNVSGSDVTIKVDIVDCYMRWYDVLFCDNGKGLWTKFVWFKDDAGISNEQFYHKPGGIEEGKYKLVVTSVAGVEYVWEKFYSSVNYLENENKPVNFDVFIYPNPLSRGSNLKIELSENLDLHASTIFIYGVNGALIHKINNPSYMNKLFIDDKFSSGLYHVVLLNEKTNQKFSKVFIVY